MTFLRLAPLGMLLAGLMIVYPFETMAARDAAFMSPGAAASLNQVKSDEAISVEPKAEVELGETQVNVGRRATFFFVNQTTSAVEIEGITANGDSNVKAEIVSDDCSKEKKIVASSRCSVTVEATPISSGTWTAELLMTHKAAGRITRARVSGKTSGTSGDKRETGLSLNTKDFKPVDFGDVEVGSGKAVRTALMVNDSNEVISILSVEIIAADNGLQKLDQGCTPDMDLKMGESCPITMVWKPEVKANVSTDLIIRHSGRLGFAVIPIRGAAKETVLKGADGKEIITKSSAPVGAGGGSSRIPLSPTADELEKMIQNGKIPQLPEDALPPGFANAGTGGGKSSKISVAQQPQGSVDGYHLIGTVGNRAVIYKPDGSTAIVAIGEEISVDDTNVMKVTNVSAKEAEVFFAGKKKILKLETVSALTQKAVQAKALAPKGDRDALSKSVAPTVSTSVAIPMGKQ